jgi:hypothetical protein
VARRRLAGVGGKRIDALVVQIAVSPILTRFVRSDDRMLRLFEVFRGMSIGRIVAASHVTAREAQTQMNPNAARLQTLRAAWAARLDARGSLRHILQVRTGIRHTHFGDCTPARGESLAATTGSRFAVASRKVRTSHVGTGPATPLTAAGGRSRGSKRSSNRDRTASVIRMSTRDGGSGLPPERPG